MALKVENDFKDIYFIGISGLLMSSLACAAKSLGYTVSGSDHNAYPPATTLLDEHQIDWTSGFSAENIKSPDLVILGNHIRENNIELNTAIAKKLRIVSFPEFVNLLFSHSEQVIVPAGAHGKSTITSLIGHILNDALYEPTILIGAVSRNLKSSFKLGNNKYLVIEGDEYTSSCLDKTPKFHHYHPHVAIITSIDLDHFDIYDTPEKQFGAYEVFCKTIRPGGTLLLCADSVGVMSLANVNPQINVQTYGFGEECDWKASKVENLNGKSTYTIQHKNVVIGEFEINIPGLHNIQNSIAAIAVAVQAGVPLDKIQSSVKSFIGVGKRFEIKGEANKVTVISDYAHHPTAIKKTLEAVKSNYQDKTIWCVYEPHTYSRVKGLLAEYKGVFDAADNVIISDIFPAREEALAGIVSAKDIIAVCQPSGADIIHIPQSAEILQHLISNVKPNSAVIFMAVGNLDNIADKLLEYMKSQD